MTRFSKATWCAAVVPLLVGCTHSEAQFGPEQQVPAAQRPLVFGQDHKQRFGLQDFGKPAAGGEAGFTADTPAGWEAQPPSGEFRQLVWRVQGEPDTDCYLTAKPVGPLALNVERWYQKQFAQTPPTDEQIAAMPRFELLGRSAILFSIEGTFAPSAGKSLPGYRMLLLAATEGDDIVATLKFTGPAAVVGAHRDAFLALAKSVRAPAGGAGPGPHAGANPGPPPAGDGAPFTAEIPSGWTALGDTGSRLLRHRFGSQGECYVGQIGSALRDNLRIWYGEMAQKEPDDAAIAALAKASVLGKDGVLIDLKGDFQGMSGVRLPDARMLVVVCAADRGVVFVKCVGPAAEVEQQRAAFLAFCASLRRTGA